MNLLLLLGKFRFDLSGFKMRQKLEMCKFLIGYRRLVEVNRNWSGEPDREVMLNYSTRKHYSYLLKQVFNGIMWRRNGIFLHISDLLLTANLVKLICIH